MGPLWFQWGLYGAVFRSEWPRGLTPFDVHDGPAVVQSIMLIYMLLNLVEERCYVGQTKASLSERVAAHWEQARGGGTSILNAAMRKWDDPCFWEAVVLQRCSCEEVMDDMETFWIQDLSSREPGVGYNAQAGRASPMNEELKAHFSRQGANNSPKPKRVSPLAGMSDEEKRAYFSECGKRGAGVAKVRGA